MFTDLFKAIGQLPDPRFRKVLGLGIVGALILYLLLWAAMAWLLSATQVLETPWMEGTADIVGGLAAGLLSLLFFPAVVTTVIGVLLDDIAEAVEAKHYPFLPAARPQPVWETLLTTLRFLLVLVAVNLVALPVYLVLLITGFGILLYYAVNGYLISREYFEMVALRRMSPERARTLRRVYLGRLWLSGVLMTFLLSLPLVNLVAPMICTAFMVHRVNRLILDNPLPEQPSP